MSLCRTLTSVVALAALAGSSLLGCASSQKRDSAPVAPTNVGGHGYYWRDPAPAPAPKAAPKAAAPAPRASDPCNPVIGAGMMTAAQAFPTGEVSSSAVQIREVFPGTVRAGQQFPYEIYVSNLTNTTLNNVVVSSTSLSNRNIVSSTPAATQGPSGPTWVIGDLAPRECKVIKAVATASAVGSSSSCLTVSYNNALCSTLQVVQPALTITKTMTPSALLCDPIVANITVKNTGSGAADNVVIKDTLPAGLTTSDGKQVVEINAGTLAAGQERSFPLNLKATKTGKFDNNAQATADGGLTATSQTVSTTVTQPVLKIAAECPTGGPVGRGGRNFTFKFTVSNTGDAACGTTVTATLPAGTTFVSADNAGAAGPNGVTWNVGSIAPGASKAVTMVVRAAGSGSFQTTATATCPCAGAVSANCSVSTTGLPDIGTQITDDDGVVDVGNNHTFRYEVKNQGFIDLTNVKAVFTLDEGLSFVSSDAVPAVSAQGQTVTANVGTLKVGETKRFVIVARGTKGGQFVIQSVTTSDQTKSVRNDEQVNYVGN